MNSSRTPIGNYGKFRLISHLTEGAEPVNRTSAGKPGDDAAVIDSGSSLTLVSTDLLLEGIHFNLVYTPLKHLGYKAVIRAISDIYSMNGTPGQVLAAIGVSSRFVVEQLEELYAGIMMACKRYEVDLAGGDMTSSVTGLTIGMTAVGTVGKDSIVKRSGARPNDLICVTGDFGASYMGLQLLERERKLFDKDSSFQPDLSGKEYIVGRQLKPEFPAKIIDSLRDEGILPTAMIDVSDGLASDLIHVCRLSGTGCRIWYDRIPVDTETAMMAEEFGIDPVTAALNGGEDYELLFTADLADMEKVRNIPGVKVIGHMTAPGEAYVLVNEAGTEAELKAQGWEGN